jgi:hypothetical protein
MESKARNVSVLLVEDEALIRMMIAGMIEELGHTVVAEAGNIAHALRLAKTADFGIAILDINVGGDRIEPVAPPFAFCLCQRLWRGRLAGKIPRPTRVAKAICDKEAGRGHRSGVGVAVDVALAATMSWLILGVVELLLSPFF